MTTFAAVFSTIILVSVAVIAVAVALLMVYLLYHIVNEGFDRE